MNKTDMKRLLPIYYQQSAAVDILMGLYSELFKNIENCLAVQERDLFIMTATNTALHEKDVGLDAIEADILTKRSRVIAKLMGSGVFTEIALIGLINVYDDTIVTIENIGDYIILVKFTVHGGVPGNMDDIKAAVEELKPVHIQINYAFRNNTWGEAKIYLHTWGEAKIYLHTWEETGTYTWGDIANKDIRRRIG